MRGRLTDIRFDDRDGVVVATLEGEVDGSNAHEVADALTTRTTSAARGLVVDLGQVTYLDSTGIELLFTLGRRLRDRRQRLCLALPSEAPTRRVLEICNVSSVAPIDADVATAIERLANRDPGSSV
jgi:anti-anti-sigma factor